MHFLSLYLECQSPLVPDNGRVVLNNGKMKVNDTATFSCYPGYMLNGVANTTCNINGTWKDKSPSCIVQSMFKLTRSEDIVVGSFC